MNRRATSKSNKIRYAVVGLGHIAQVAVLPAFKNANNSELVAIVSGEKEKREKLAKNIGSNIHTHTTITTKLLLRLMPFTSRCRTIYIVNTQCALRKPMCTYSAKSPWLLPKKTAMQ